MVWVVSGGLGGWWWLGILVVVWGIDGDLGGWWWLIVVGRVDAC